MAGKEWVNISTYAYKRDFNYSVTAEEGQQELERIREKHGALKIQLLKTQYIVDESRPENTILHSIFEWDDPVAAEKYRNVQAGEYVRNIITVTEEHKTRVYHNITVTIEDHTDRGFLPIIEIAKDDNLWSQIIDRARRDFENLRNKYQTLIQSRPIISDAIEIVLKELKNEEQE